MADKLVLELDLETGDISTVFNDVEKKAKGAGKKSGKGFSSEFGKEVDVLGFASKRLLAVGAAISSAFAFEKTIAAAREQERAITRLAGALKSSNEFTEEAINNFQQFAAELQNTSTFGDEVILDQLALAKAFGATNKQAEEIVTAAADLSSALGIDLNSAVRNVSKTLGGYAGELGETIPELKNLTREQLQAGAGIDILSKKFEGQAANAVRSFDGAFQQLNNSLGDYLENLGFAVTRNPAVLAAIRSTTEVFKELNKETGEIGDNIGVDPATIELLNTLGDAVLRFVIIPFELAKNAANVAFSQIQESIAAAVAVVGRTLGGFADLVTSKLNIDNSVLQGFKDFRDSSNAVFVDFANQTNESAESIFDFPVSDKINRLSTLFRDTFVKVQQEIIEGTEPTKAIAEEAATDIVEPFLKIPGVLELAFGQPLKKTKEQIQQFKNQVVSIINNGLARGIAGGIQNIVQSLAKGESVFENFGKFILNAFGDLAIQLGTFFIAEGIAAQALIAVNPPSATIAAGAALVALGSVLKSFGGGGASQITTNGAGGGVADTTGSAGGFNPADGLSEDAAAEPDTNVSIVVQGDVLDSDETGTRIANILSEAFGKQGVVLTDARFA